MGIQYILYIVTDSIPEKRVLLKCLSSISYKWYEIGDQLGVDENTLNGLLTKTFSDQVKLSITFQSWLNNQPTPTTWRNIIKVIEEEPIQNKSLATTIQEKLIQGGIFITCFMLLCSVPCHCIIGQFSIQFIIVYVVNSPQII